MQGLYRYRDEIPLFPTYRSKVREEMHSGLSGLRWNGC